MQSFFMETTKTDQTAQMWFESFSAHMLEGMFSHVSAHILCIESPWQKINTHIFLGDLL